MRRPLGAHPPDEQYRDEVVLDGLPPERAAKLYWRYMRDFLHVASAFGISRDELLADLPIATADLESARGRVPWSECLPTAYFSFSRLSCGETHVDCLLNCLKNCFHWQTKRSADPRGLSRA